MKAKSNKKKPKAKQLREKRAAAKKLAKRQPAVPIPASLER
jgi:hypothetical protein